MGLHNASSPKTTNPSHREYPMKRELPKDDYERLASRIKKPIPCS
jgi:hypothetical protein